MRNFRDAKSMAHDLREALAARNDKITVGESLEIVARLFGVSDWNTLSALIKQACQEPHRAQPHLRVQSPRFTETTEAALHSALRAAHERFHPESTLEHLLLALTKAPDAAALMKSRGLDPAAIRNSVASSAEIAKLGDPAPGPIDPVPSPAFQRVVQRAILDAQASKEMDITTAHLLLALASEQDGTAVRILRKHGFESGEA